MATAGSPGTFIEAVNLLLGAVAYESQRVSVSSRSVVDVRIEIWCSFETQRVFSKESTHAWIVVSEPRKLEVGLGVPFATGVAERIGQGTARRRQIPK